MILISKQRLREVAEFLAPNRLHMKQGLLDTQYRDPLSPPNFLRGFGFNNEALKFFMGAKLTSDEQLKIDKTLVAEVDNSPFTRRPPPSLIPSLPHLSKVNCVLLDFSTRKSRQNPDTCRERIDSPNSHSGQIES